MPDRLPWEETTTADLCVGDSVLVPLRGWFAIADFAHTTDGRVVVVLAWHIRTGCSPAAARKGPQLAVLARSKDAWTVRRREDAAPWGPTLADREVYQRSDHARRPA